GRSSTLCTASMRPLNSSHCEICLTSTGATLTSGGGDAAFSAWPPLQAASTARVNADMLASAARRSVGDCKIPFISCSKGEVIRGQKDDGVSFDIAVRLADRAGICAALRELVKTL